MDTFQRSCRKTKQTQTWTCQGSLQQKCKISFLNTQSQMLNPIYHSCLLAIRKMDKLRKLKMLNSCQSCNSLSSKCNLYTWCHQWGELTTLEHTKDLMKKMYCSPEGTLSQKYSQWEKHNSLFELKMLHLVYVSDKRRRSEIKHNLFT